VELEVAVQKAVPCVMGHVMGQFLVHVHVEGLVIFQYQLLVAD